MLGYLGAGDMHNQCTSVSEQLSRKTLVWLCPEPEGALKIKTDKAKVPQYLLCLGFYAEYLPNELNVPASHTLCK